MYYKIARLAAINRISGERLACIAYKHSGKIGRFSSSVFSFFVFHKFLYIYLYNGHWCYFASRLNTIRKCFNSFARRILLTFKDLCLLDERAKTLSAKNPYEIYTQ
jgi:hypothetical protein